MFLFLSGLDIEALGDLNIGGLAFGRDGPADAVVGHLSDSSAPWTIAARLGRELRNPERGYVNAADSLMSYRLRGRKWKLGSMHERRTSASAGIDRQDTMPLFAVLWGVQLGIEAVEHMYPLHTRDSERRIRILELNSTRMYESLMRAFLSIERVDHPAHPPRYLALQTAFGTIINGISIINLSILHMAHLVCHFPFEFYGSGQDIAHRNPARPSSTCSIIA